MAKSKLVQANEKIAEDVVSGYKKIEESVVGGYKKIEQGAVDGFNKMSDKFVDSFLTKEGESVEDAKKRLNAEQKAREEVIVERKKTPDFTEISQKKVKGTQKASDGVRKQIGNRIEINNSETKFKHNTNSGVIDSFYQIRHCLSEKRKGRF